MRALDSTLDIEALPSGWSAVRTRFLCDVDTGTADTVDAEPDEAYPFFVRSENVERASHFTFDGEAVLTSGDGAGVGKIYHHYIGKFLAHQRVYVMSHFRGCIGRYFYYYLSSEFGPQVLAGTAKSTVESLRRPMLTDFLVAVPPEDEQRAIVDFLDRETAQIDAMIEGQRDLVKWLEDRRSAMVTQVVFEAVGRESMPLRYGIRPLEQGWSPVCENSNVDDPSTQWSVLKVGCVNTGRFDPLQNKALPPEVEPRPELTVRAGDVLVSRGNTRELVGGAAMVDRDYPALMLSDLLYRIRVRPERLRPLFLSLALQTRPVRDQIEMKAKGTSHSMQKISQQDLRELVIPLVPLAAQVEIETQVNSTTAKMDAMIDAANESVALMQERRAALISAAVTGRIDPRSGQESGGASA